MTWNGTPRAWSMLAVAAVAALALLSFPAIHALSEPTPAPGGRYASKGWPDRIVLSPGADASREMAVGWRTDTRQSSAEAQIAQDIDGPLLEHAAKAQGGNTQMIETENGRAHHHHVRFTGLVPGTRYVYRVRGADGWSEWLPFTTARADAAPFRFIYFGDNQNDILDIGSRVIRSALQAAGPTAVVLHAGDQVSQRDDMVHDDEHGEWAASGGASFATIPQAVAAGNHEYVDALAPDGSESRVLGPLWAHFALPQNGAEPVAKTTYYFDYQGVRFIVLDGTSAIDLGTLDSQTAWLDHTLAESPAQWNIVVLHQPIYTCARPKNSQPIHDAWRPVLERHNVDLVLQGHDHCYGRVSHPDGAEASHRSSADGDPVGPVYVVSVTGSKMYGLNDRADTEPVRVAENTQLYQLVDVSAERIDFRAYTATGALYDSFALVKGQDGRNRLVEAREQLLSPRRCGREGGLDDRPCTARKKD